MKRSVEVFILKSLNHGCQEFYFNEQVLSCILHFLPSVQLNRWLGIWGVSNICERVRIHIFKYCLHSTVLEACEFNYYHILELISTLKFLPNTSFNEADVFGNTPLSTACKNGHLEAVKCVLDNVDNKVVFLSCHTEF